jgi:thioredoxin-related protein
MASAEETPRQHLDAIFQHFSYSAAWTAAQKNNRPLMLYVTTSGCPYCVKMAQSTLKNREIRSLVADSFETVYVDRIAQAKLVAKLNIRYYPTTILVSTNNQVLDVIEGYVEPMTFQRRLQTNLGAFQTTSIKKR